MPGDEARTARLLDEKIGGPAEEIRTQDVFGGIEERRMVHDLINPGEQQVRLVSPIPLQRGAGLRLMLLQALSVMRDFAGAERRDRKVKSVAAVSLDR